MLLPIPNSFDYHPLGRGPSFVFLLLVLSAIATTLSVLLNLILYRTSFATCFGKTPCSVPQTTPALGASVPVYSAQDGQQQLSDAIWSNSYELKFTSDSEWEDWTINATRKWESMLPADPLAQDDHFNEGVPYGIGMLHQIHSLHEIRTQYTALLAVDGTTDSEREFSQGDTQMRHIAHCFNWIRQALLCHADSHREVLIESPTGGNTEKYARICGDTKALYDEVGVRGDSSNKHYKR